MAAGLLALPFGTAHAAETPVYDTSQAALAQSQLRDVTGRVTDRATGDPIVGVTGCQMWLSPAHLPALPYPVPYETSGYPPPEPSP